MQNSTIQLFHQSPVREALTWRSPTKRMHPLIFLRPFLDKQNVQKNASLITTDLSFQTHMCIKLSSWLLTSRAQSTTVYLWKFVEWTSHSFEALRWNLDSPKFDFDFVLSRFSNSEMSKTNGLSSSNKTLFDSFFSVDNSSKWNALIFAEAAEFSR